MIFKSKVAKGFINVAGIESPGLASAPAIALYVEDLLKEVMDEDNRELEINKNFNPIREKNKPFMEMSSMEQREILNKDERYKTIICRCENITEGEIVDAINRPCGAKQ